jgi:hypothetical protein
MKAFSIDIENNITVHASAKAVPRAEGVEVFAGQKALAELAATWPASRLIEIWNSLPGVKPVRKFTDRGTAVTRIWNAIQSLEPAAPQTVHVAPEEAPATRKASVAKKPPTVATKAKGSREGTKTETILGLLKQKGGSTIQAVMEATGWQAHSVRGFISAVVTRKMGLKVESTRGADGQRTYSVQA